MRRFIGRGCILTLLFVVCSRGLATRADQTTFGVTLNATTGHHIESGATQSVPLLPLPMLQIEHTHRRLKLLLEIVPPIGPIPLAQGNGPSASEDPRVSYLDGQALYGFAHGRFAFGVGETIINQRTLYAPNSYIQSSRIVGTRYVVRALLHETPGSRLDAMVAFNPSLHGVQFSFLPWATQSDPERGSLVDASLRWRVPFKRYTLAYGLRYINYTAAYSDGGNLADRNHLFMPFVGLIWHAQHRLLRLVAPAVPNSPKLTFSHAPARKRETTFGFTINGTTGSQIITGYSRANAQPFVMLPAFAFAHRVGRLEVRAEGIFPTANVDPFGPGHSSWSYLDSGLRYYSANRRYALGLSDTVINQHSLLTGHGFLSRSRHEGLRISALAALYATLRERLALSVGVIPYLHDAIYYTETLGGPPPGLVRNFEITHRGSLVDASLRWTVKRGAYRLSYGLRYMNQTINVLSFNRPPRFHGPSAIIENNTSFMPFIGLSKRFGR